MSSFLITYGVLADKTTRFALSLPPLRGGPLPLTRRGWRRDKGDGSVWHAKKQSHLRYSMLRWDYCYLQTCQTEPSPLSLVEVKFFGKFEF